MFVNVHKKGLGICLITVLFIAITSCEKEITVDLPPAKDKLVIEGRIEQGDYPYVYISKNSPYFEATDLNSLQSYLVKNAIITVSDGVLTDTLKEVIPGQGYFYRGTRLKGEVGKSYTLVVMAEGKRVTAVTSIPKPVKLDSIWFKPRANGDSLGFIWVHLSEPAGLGNCYRLMTKRLNNDFDNVFVAPPNSVFNDKFIDGKSFDFVLSRGYKPNSNTDDYKNSERHYFKTGDLVVLKFAAVDENIYEFYKGYEIELSSNGNPFANPVNIKTNIEPSESALGIWSGYGISLDTLLLIIPK